MTDPPGQITIGATQVDLRAHRVLREPEVIALSAQEVAILEAFVRRGNDVTLSRADLYREAWGYTREPRGRAIDYAIRRLRAKLGADSPTGPVLGTVRGVGYRLSWGAAPVAAALSAPSPPPAPRAAAEVDDGVIGRDPLVLEALEALQAPGCLLSLLGPGGIGKSTVAEAIAARLGADAWTWVDLEAAPVGGAAAAIERAMFGEREDDTPLPARLHKLSAVTAGGVYLILDGGERHTDELRPLLGALQGSTLRVVLTTRARLQLQQEHVLPVPPLSAAHALRLLQRVAGRRGASVGLDAEAAAPLLAQLDGLPLALELAGAGLRSRTPAELASALAAGRPLRSRDRDREQRHGSMETVVRSSLDRLPPDIQQGLHDLCALQGNFGVDAASWALGVDPFDAEEILEDLLDASMLHVVVVDQVTAYRVLRPTRSAMFAARGAPDAAHARLAAHFDRLGRADPVRTLGRAGGALSLTLRKHVEDVLFAFRASPDPPAGLALLTTLIIRLVGPWESIRALGRAVTTPGVPGDPLKALAVIYAAVNAGAMDELRAVLDGFPEADGPTTRLVELVRISGPLADPKAVEAEASALVERASAAGDRYVEARACASLGTALLQRGALDDAGAVFRRYLRASEQDDHLDNQISAWSRLGQIGFHNGRIEEAIQRIEAARRLAGPDHRYAGVLVSNLGLLHLHRGDNAAAAEAITKGIALARRDANLVQVALSLGNLSEVLAELGRRDEARASAEQAVELALAHLATPDAADRSWGHLAVLHCTGGRFSAAAACRDRWFAHFGPPTNPQSAGILRALEAWIEAGLGHPDAARALLAAPAVLTPVASITRGYFAAHARLEMGDRDGVRAELEAARALSRTHPVAPYLMDRIGRLEAQLT